MKKITLILGLLVSVFPSEGQEKVSIVTIIDDLTVKWDQAALELKIYQGIQNFCAEKTYRGKTIELLDNIHHWDTSLYFIVRNKYALNEDEEAEATLKDIEVLETEYSTQNFKKFIQDECARIKEIEDGFSSETPREYERNVKRFEKELIKYVNSITSRIDIIDEHIHHLKLD
ncbi:MAG: hypothetical protein RIM99_18755 [Cyclobacteriaceae bacterium]